MFKQNLKKSICFQSTCRSLSVIFRIEHQLPSLSNRQLNVTVECGVPATMRNGFDWMTKTYHLPQFEETTTQNWNRNLWGHELAKAMMVHVSQHLQKHLFWHVQVSSARFGCRYFLILRHDFAAYSRILCTKHQKIGLMPSS